MVRFKNRYLTFAVRWGEEGAARLSPSKIAELLRASLALNFGAHGSGAEERALQVKYYDAVTGLGMVRCTREGKHRVWASMTFINEAGGKGVALTVLDSSGSIRCASSALLRVWRGAMRARISAAAADRGAWEEGFAADDAPLVDDERILTLIH